MFDNEPTSSIDSKTESVILDALDRLMIGRTTFMVAHRLSTIRNADIILVLNQIDAIQEPGTLDMLKQRYPLALPVSARTGEGSHWSPWRSRDHPGTRAPP